MLRTGRTRKGQQVKSGRSQSEAPRRGPNAGEQGREEASAGVVGIEPDDHEDGSGVQRFGRRVQRGSGH